MHSKQVLIGDALVYFKYILQQQYHKTVVSIVAYASFGWLVTVNTGQETMENSVNKYKNSIMF